MSCPARFLAAGLAGLAALLALSGAPAWAKPTGATQVGCTHRVQASYRLGPARRRREPDQISWWLAATASCELPEQMLQVRLGLQRDGALEPGSDLVAACSLGAGPPCRSVSTAGSFAVPYSPGSWRSVLVVVSRGAGAVAQWWRDPDCLIDVPSLIVYCTYYGGPIPVG